MRIYAKVIPRSSQNEIVKISEGEYKIKITAPPVDNQANEKIIEILSEYFKVPKSLVKIVGGKTSRTKIIDVGV